MVFLSSPPPPPPAPLQTEIYVPKTVMNYQSTIDLYDILINKGLEEYFRNLKNITKDEIQSLPPPSRNRFMVTEEGIIFYRQGKEEHREIRVENKGAGLHINQLEYDEHGWKIRVTARKLGMNFRQDDPQILDRGEISQIFGALEQGKTYTRPKTRPDGQPYKLILVVKRR